MTIRYATLAEMIKNFAESGRVSYRMWGLPCGICGKPLDHMSVFSGHMEMWHCDDFAVDRSKLSESPQPCVAPMALPRPPKRRRKGLLGSCPQCGTLHTDKEDLCRSCRNQYELLAREEVK